jgi:hypothetical protein
LDYKVGKAKSRARNSILGLRDYQESLENAREEQKKEEQAKAEAAKLVVQESTESSVVSE